MMKAQSDQQLPTSVLRGIGDKLYERRKQGSLWAYPLAILRTKMPASC